MKKIIGLVMALVLLASIGGCYLGWEGDGRGGGRGGGGHHRYQSQQQGH